MTTGIVVSSSYKNTYASESSFLIVICLQKKIIAYLVFTS